MDDDVYVPVGRVVVRCGRRRRTEDGDAVLGRRRDDVPLAVDAEVVRRHGARRVGDVHARAVVRVGSDQQQTALRVEREVRDVDVARGPENAAWLPVQLDVVAWHLTRMMTRPVQAPSAAGRPSAAERGYGRSRASARRRCTNAQTESS